MFLSILWLHSMTYIYNLTIMCFTQQLYSEVYQARQRKWSFTPPYVDHVCWCMSNYTVMCMHWDLCSEIFAAYVGSLYVCPSWSYIWEILYKAYSPSLYTRSCSSWVCPSQGYIRVSYVYCTHVLMSTIMSAWVNLWEPLWALASPLWSHVSPYEYSVSP